MQPSSFKLYLGSVPGHLSENELGRLLRLQVSSFVKVETTKSNGHDRIAQNNGYAFLMVSDVLEYERLIKQDQILRIKDRNIKVTEYKSGSALRSEKILAPSRKMYIRGIPPTMTDLDLGKVLASAGLKPKLAFCAKKSSTLEKKNFGFAEFHDVESAQMALNLGKALLPNSSSEFLLFERFKPKHTAISRVEAGQMNLHSPSNQTHSDTGSAVHQPRSQDPSISLAVGQQKFLAYNKQKYCIPSELELGFDNSNDPLSPESCLGGSRSSSGLESSGSPSRKGHLKPPYSVFPSSHPFDGKSSFVPKQRSDGFHVIPSTQFGQSVLPLQKDKRTTGRLSSRPDQAKRYQQYEGQSGSSEEFEKSGVVSDPSRLHRPLYLPYEPGVKEDSKDSEHLTRPWLESVKASAPRCLDHAFQGSNLRFNIDVSPLNDLVSDLT